MGLYGDGGIKFAEEKFADARKYKDDQAEKQNKFARNLLGIDALVSGGNFLIDERAKEADEKNLWAKGNYESLLEQSKKIREQDNLNKSKNISNSKYLENNFYNQILAQATEDYPAVDVNNLKPAFRKQAATMASESLTQYNAMLKNASAIPTFGKNGEEFEEWFSSNASDVPRNAAQWVGKKVKRYFKTNDKETLTSQVSKADEYNPSTKAFQPFGTLEQSIKSYHQATEDGFELAETIKQAKKDGLYLGKVVKIFNPVSVDTINYTKGTKTSTLTTTVLRENVNNIEDSDGKVAAYIQDSYTSAPTVSEIKDNRLTHSDIMNVKKLIALGSPTAKALDKIFDGDNTFKAGTKAMKIINENPQDLIINWNDEKNILESFDIFYSNLIQFSEHGKTEKTIYLSKFDDNTKLYTINPMYKDEVNRQGLDRESQLSQFRKFASRSNFIVGVNSLSGPISTPLDFTNVSSLLKDNPDDLKTLETMLGTTGMAFNASGYNLMPKIEQATMAGLKYVDLNIHDLGSYFDIDSLKGNKAHLYFDIENNTFVTGK